MLETSLCKKNSIILQNLQLLLLLDISSAGTRVFRVRVSDFAVASIYTIRPPEIRRNNIMMIFYAPCVSRITMKGTFHLFGYQRRFGTHTR